MGEASIAEQLGNEVERISAAALPSALKQTARNLLLDTVGLCVATRRADYVAAMLEGLDAGGDATAIGHTVALDTASAILLNGTAAHGEDYDDTFEGGPVHTGAVIVPAMLNAAERHALSGADLLRGLAVGAELMCRLSLVAPRAVHKAGFHPTSVFGAVGAAGAVAAGLRLSGDAFASALGIAGSMASGIIEYLAEGAWTKRLHAGWAGQSGYRAARLAAAGFVGPRTVLEGQHGLFQGFARGAASDWSQLIDGFGTKWVSETIAFKPYPCGTMNHPYIDCALRLRANGLPVGEIESIVCETAEGFVHRLWEPLQEKQQPTNGYSAKFSVPYAIAAALMRGEVGLATFADQAVRDPGVIAMARRVTYVIDPDHPYPRQYTGHMRVALRDGTVVEERQPHLRGGAAEPLSAAEITAKFFANARHGGWDEVRTDRVRAWIDDIFDSPKVELALCRG